MRHENLASLERYLESVPHEKKGLFFLVLSKEPHEVSSATELLLKTLLKGEKEELALTVCEGASVDEEKLLEAFDSPSLFAKMPVFLIAHFDKSKKKVQEWLEKTLSDPSNRSLHVILTASSLPKTSALYKAFDQFGIIVDFPELKPWEKEKQMAEWVLSHGAKRGKAIPQNVCRLLVKLAGADRVLLAQEMEKLFCYCLEKPSITAQDVEMICTHEQHDTIWSLGEAIFQSDTAQALSIAKEFMSKNQPFLPLLRQIRAQFQTGYQLALLLAQGKESRDLAAEFPYMKGQILEKNIYQAKHFGLHRYKKGLLAIDETELKAKNSSANEALLLELLLLNLTD